MKNIVILVFSVLVVGCATSSIDMNLIHNADTNLKGWSIFKGKYHGDHGDCAVALKKEGKVWKVGFGPSVGHAFSEVKGSFSDRDIGNQYIRFQLDDKTQRSAAIRIKNGAFDGLYWAFDPTTNPDGKDEGQSKFCK